MTKSNSFLIYYKSIKIEHPLNYCFPHVTKYSAWRGIIRPPELPLYVEHSCANNSQWIIYWMKFSTFLTCEPFRSGSGLRCYWLLCGVIQKFLQQFCLQLIQEKNPFHYCKFKIDFALGQQHTPGQVTSVPWIDEM